jgi:hypothetical protein
MRIERIDSFLGVNPEQWDALSGGIDPFLTHAFLSGLERHDCLAAHGWTPCHLLLLSGDRLLGAMPLYLKPNSIGEFVFDGSWAEAYERSGRRYYPKLVCAVPFTPVSGRRLLVAPDAVDQDAVRRQLVAAAVDLMEQLRLSSVHCLFADQDDLRLLEASGFLRRAGCQYHWFNRGYQDFEDFLDTLCAKRRKEIRRERRAVRAAGVEVEILSGLEISPEHWRVFHGFYCSTFLRKWGNPRFNLDFFIALGRAMPDATLLLLARRRGRYIAGAFAMRGADTLYGRHWGCSEQVNYLHFELCYYQTIEYCIRHGIARLDAGAQGEHKLNRGFVPVLTWSGHRLRDDTFARAVAGFLERERMLIDDYMNSLIPYPAYRQGVIPP